MHSLTYTVGDQSVSSAVIVAYGLLDKDFGVSPLPSAGKYPAPKTNPFGTVQSERRLAEPYQACMKAAAQRLDDGLSDIAVLGKAVADACQPQFEEMIAELGKNLSPQDQNTLRVSQSGQQVGFGTVVVGEVRAAKRGKNSN